MECDAPTPCLGLLDSNWNIGTCNSRLNTSHTWQIGCNTPINLVLYNNSQQRNSLLLGFDGRVIIMGPLKFRYEENFQNKIVFKRLPKQGTIKLFSQKPQNTIFSSTNSMAPFSKYNLARPSLIGLILVQNLSNFSKSYKTLIIDWSVASNLSSKDDSDELSWLFGVSLTIWGASLLCFPIIFFSNFCNNFYHSGWWIVVEITTIKFREILINK